MNSNHQALLLKVKRNVCSWNCRHSNSTRGNIMAHLRGRHWLLCQGVARKCWGGGVMAGIAVLVQGCKPPVREVRLWSLLPSKQHLAQLPELTWNAEGQAAVASAAGRSKSKQLPPAFLALQGAGCPLEKEGRPPQPAGRPHWAPQ